MEKDIPCRIINLCFVSTHNRSVSLYVILLDGINKHILSWVELSCNPTADLTNLRQQNVPLKWPVDGYIRCFKWWLVVCSALRHYLKQHLFVVSIGPVEIYRREIRFKIWPFSATNKHSKMSGTCWSLCPCLNDLIQSCFQLISEKTRSFNLA